MESIRSMIKSGNRSFQIRDEFMKGGRYTYYWKPEGDGLPHPFRHDRWYGGADVRLPYSEEFPHPHFNKNEYNDWMNRFKHVLRLSDEECKHNSDRLYADWDEAVKDFESKYSSTNDGVIGPMDAFYSHSTIKRDSDSE